MGEKCIFTVNKRQTLKYQVKYPNCSQENACRDKLSRAF